MPDSSILDQPQISVLEDGTKVVIEYSINEEGKKIKTTRKIKTTLVKTKVNHDIAERKRLAKFGDAKGLPVGPDATSTSLGDKVMLEMSQGLKDPEAVNTDALKKEASAKAKVSCRTCKGDHWTSKCPYKETSMSAMDSESKSAADADQAAKPGKYVPPSMRNRVPGEEGGFRERRDDSSTVRVTNLSETTNEEDLRALVFRIGPVARVFVARHKDTNLCKGFAFVNFIHRDDAIKAVTALNGHKYDNLIINAELSNPTNK